MSRLDLEDKNVTEVELSLEFVRDTLIGSEGSNDELDLALDEMQGLVMQQEVTEAYVVIKIK